MCAPSVRWDRGQRGQTRRSAPTGKPTFRFKPARSAERILEQADSSHRVSVQYRATFGGMPKLDLKRYIRDVPHFPTAGILFRDITPLIKDPAAS